VSPPHGDRKSSRRPNLRRRFRARDPAFSEARSSALPVDRHDPLCMPGSALASQTQCCAGV
jgi:hypothetical protein